MADGLNDARALRITELLRDYQAIQSNIAEYEAFPGPGEQDEAGYTTLRQCHADAQALLSAPYSSEMLHPPTAVDDAAKRQLQRYRQSTPKLTRRKEGLTSYSNRVIIDASVRRFKAQRIFLRATAAIKWVNARRSILKHGKPKNGDVARLQQLENEFRQIQELNGITDARIVDFFRTQDQQNGFWLDDDPALGAIQGWIRSHG